MREKTREKAKEKTRKNIYLTTGEEGSSDVRCLLVVQDLHSRISNISSRDP